MIINAFKISPKDYQKILFNRFINRWWFIFALLIGGISLLSVFNINFIYVALMVIFIIIPMIVTYLYFYYGLLPESRSAILEKSAEFTDNGITYIYKQEDKPDRIEVFNWDSIKGIEVGRKWVLLVFKRNDYTFLCIPYSAFDSSEEFSKFMLFIRSKTGSC